MSQESTSAYKSAADMSGNGLSVQLTIRVLRTHLDEITAIAESQGITRASYIKQAIALKVNADKSAKEAVKK